MPETLGESEREELVLDFTGEHAWQICGSMCGVPRHAVPKMTKIHPNFADGMCF